MKDSDWKLFLSTCRQVLGSGSHNPVISNSWCAYTTFSALQHNVTYWNCGFPDEIELLDKKTLDGGLWGQSFEYSDLAHIIIPNKFFWENFEHDEFKSGYKYQDINLLSKSLHQLHIKHRITEILLEIKLY